MKRVVLSAIIFAATITPATAKNPAHLVDTAQARTALDIRYDGAYVRLDYPGGDVAANTGVCTDVIIRSYRSAYGFDFQQAVHEDMRAEFAAYPANWGLSRPDKNIDHRRVPNLETYLTRRGAKLPTGETAEDFKAGDIVTWQIDNRLPHIGIVTDRKSADGTPLIVHNIGAGPVEDDILFAYPITAHFRFHPEAE